MSDTPNADDDKLVVAISSRALFDFEEENRVFDPADPRAYMQLQLERLDTPARPGVAFSLVRKLLAFNTPGAGRTLGVDSDSQPTTPKPDWFLEACRALGCLWGSVLQPAVDLGDGGFAVAAGEGLQADA